MPTVRAGRPRLAAWRRAVTVVSAGLTPVLAAGCAASSAAPPHAASTPTTQLAQIRGEALEMKQGTVSYSGTIARTIRLVNIEADPALGGSYLPCATRSTRLKFTEAITVRPSAATTTGQLTSKIVAVLHADGWQLVNVDMSKMRLPLGALPHPLYRMHRSGFTGEANILPYPQRGAEALIFVNSACFEAGSASQSLERRGVAG